MGAATGVERTGGPMTQDTRVEEQALGWFVRLSDVAATEADWRAFADWIAASPEHGAAFDAIEQVWIELDAGAAREIAPVLAAQAAPSAANDDARVSRRKVWFYPLAGAAAAAALAIGFWPQFLDRPTVYRTGTEPLAITLKDGSRARLNRHSEMSVRLGGGRRQVILDEGEAAFDVAHDAERPFVIDASGRQIEVIGTAFNVINHNDVFVVGVERGVVAVHAKAAAPVRLTAGQEIRQTGDLRPVVASVDPDSVSAWRSGVLVYRDAPLVQVGSDLSRYFHKPVRLSHSARNLRFTGALRVADETTMLDQLRDFAPVNVDRTPTEVRLSARGEG